MHLFAPLLLLAAAHVEVPQPTPLPGGFVDPTGRIGIFNTPGGGIQAVELATGKSFWQTDHAQRPLFVAAGRVFALAAVHAPVLRGLCFEWHPEWDGPPNGFRLVAFDLRQPDRIVVESEAVALPEWASLADTHDRSFAVRWRVEDGRLVLSWEAKTWYAGRTKKTAQEEAAYRKRADGAVRFDLKTGSFEEMKPPAAPGPAAPPTVEGWKELERHAIRWQKAAGDRHIVLTLEEDRGTQTLTLRTFDAATRRQLAATELIRGRRLTVLPTIDEQYLCVRDADAGPRADPDAPAAPWAVFAADGGRRVGDVPYEPAATAVAVLGGRAFLLVAGRTDTPLDRPFVVPRSLRAVDLRTGAAQWERPVGGQPGAPPAVIVWPAAPRPAGPRP